MKYATITPTELRASLDARMSLRQIAAHHNVGLSSVRGACTLFGWQAKFRPARGSVNQKKRAAPTQGAHNPFGVAA